MPEMQARVLEHLPIGGLRGAPKNARTHSKRQIRQIADSIERFGFTNPILIDDADQILAGHGRVEAAKLLGLPTAPCIRLSSLTEADKRAYLIADNKLALNAGWDLEILAGEMEALAKLDFDIPITGFDAIELDQLFTDATEASAAKQVPEDDRPELPSAAHVVTRLGDLWHLGRHALWCGDAKDPLSLDCLMAGEKADMLFTDPPYNVPIDGHVSGLGQTRHREFAEASGEMSSAQFTLFLKETLGAAAGRCRDGAIAYVCMDWRHLQELLAAGAEVFSGLKNLCVWSKTNAGMGTFYRSQHEMVLVWKVGIAPHTNTFGLGDRGRYRTNVWTYAGVNAFRSGRMEALAAHPTSKPVALVADAIRDVSHRGELVLDVFGGSGTTLIAAQKTGRRARLIEIDPAYCDVTIRRWQKLTGKLATLVASQDDFETVEAARCGRGMAISGGWGND